MMFFYASIPIPAPIAAPRACLLPPLTHVGGNPEYELRLHQKRQTTRWQTLRYENKRNGYREKCGILVFRLFLCTIIFLMELKTPKASKVGLPLYQFSG